MSRVSQSLAAAFALSLVLALPACTPQSDTPDTGAAMADTAPAELQSASDDAIAAWNGEDASAVAAFYADDAVVTEADSTYEGRDAIQNRWAANGLPVVSDLNATDRSFSGSGDTMTETARYSLTLTLPDSAPRNIAGNYESTWRRGADGWKITRTVITTDGEGM